MSTTDTVITTDRQIEHQRNHRRGAAAFSQPDTRHTKHAERPVLLGEAAGAAEPSSCSGHAFTSTLPAEKSAAPSGPRVYYGWYMLVLATGLAVLRLGSLPATALHSGLLLGGAQGTYFASAQPLWARYFGRVHLVKIRGVQMATHVATSSIGPLVVGLARDWLGGFGPVLLFFALLPLPFAFSAALVTPPKQLA